MADRRQATLAAVLLGIGAAAMILAWLVREEQGKNLVARPAADGQVGMIAVYAQLPKAFLWLAPGAVTRVPRPQDLAFQLSSKGTGPRRVRVEMEVQGTRTVMAEETLQAPADQTTLGFLLHLDQSSPDAFMLIVTLESPHARAVSTRYGVRLVGAGDRVRIGEAPLPLEAQEDGG